MGYYTGYEPQCSYCGKKLSKNESSGEYECLSCTFQRMDGEDIIEEKVGTPPPQQNYQEPPENSYAEYLNIQRFQQSLQNASQTLIVTKILIAANVLVHLYVLSISSNYAPKEIGQMYIDMGANIGLLTFNGEWWRLFTSMFVHGGITHLLFNMYALWVIGSIVEKLFGSFGFSCIYFMSGVLGSVFSLYNHSFNVPSVGASGAVFGIFGALVSYAYFQKMPKKISTHILKNAGLMILINAAIGLSIPQIDNSAHFGGCIAGIIAAYFIGQDITILKEKKRRNVSIIVTVACALLVFLSWDFVKKKNTGGVEDLKESLNSKRKERAEFIERFNELEISKKQEAISIIENLNKGLISKDEAAKIFETDFVDFFRKKGERLKILNEEAFVGEAFMKYTEKYLEMYIEFWSLHVDFIKTSNQNFLSEARLLEKKVSELKPEDFN